MYDGTGLRREAAGTRRLPHSGGHRDAPLGRNQREHQGALAGHVTFGAGRWPMNGTSYIGRGRRLSPLSSS